MAEDFVTKVDGVRLEEGRHVDDFLFLLCLPLHPVVRVGAGRGGLRVPDAGDRVGAGLGTPRDPGVCQGEARVPGVGHGVSPAPGAGDRHHLEC